MYYFKREINFLQNLIVLGLRLENTVMPHFDNNSDVSILNYIKLIFSG